MKSLVSASAFGVRLRQLRSSRGLTQIELGSILGISNRVVHYYEVQGGTPSRELIQRFALALGVTTRDLMGNAGPTGITPSDVPHTAQEMVLWRKLRTIQRLRPDQRRQVLRAIDRLIAQPSRAEPILGSARHRRTSSASRSRSRRRRARPS
ncbi:MAG TPA: helix-turn-helix transcriptional regulator [Polyangia bacterium]|jgi:transcriptional regulator with XRE-family HTH domain|nr:helix-turn-helix transcriptional regulator [Polyangia bacterium]